MNIHTSKRAVFVRSFARRNDSFGADTEGFALSSQRKAQIDRRNAVSAQEPKKFALSSQRKLSVLLVVGIVILSAKECAMDPMGPGGDKSFAYICPNGTVTEGTAKAADTEKCSACNEGFNLSANTCVASAPVVSVPVYQHPLASALSPAGPFSLANSAEVVHGKTLAIFDTFGKAVAFAGDLHDDGGTVLAVGAPRDDTNGTDRGAIYLLSYNASGVLQSTKKIASGVDETNTESTLAPALANNENFGNSIANAGDLYGNGNTVLAVGATGENTFRGAIYLLSFNNATASLTGTTKIASGMTNAPSLAPGDGLGISIANAGDLDGGGGVVLAVGATGDDTGGNLAGAMYLLSFNPAGALQNTKKIAHNLDATNADSNANAPSLAADYGFGSSIANAGDLYGDGNTVLAVGSSGTLFGISDVGAIHLLSFSPTGTLQNIKQISHNLDETDADSNANAPRLLLNGRFGSSLANAGDLDGGGGVVLAVGATGDATGGISAGAIYLLSFNPAGSLSTIPTKITHSTINGPTLAANYSFGSSLASAGNLDGSGGRVLAIGGAGNSSAPTNKTGALQLLYFSPPAEE